MNRSRQRPRISRNGAVYAPGRNRTCDLALRRRTLYPLSYRRGGASLAPSLGPEVRVEVVHPLGLTLGEVVTESWE